MEKCDTIHFEVFDAKEAKEAWIEIYNYVKGPLVVRIMINDEDICDNANKLDLERLKKESPYYVSPDTVMYGHATLDWVYEGLAEAFTEGSYTYDYGLDLFCCGGCGIPECCSVIAHIT